MQKLASVQRENSCVLQQVVQSVMMHCMTVGDLSKWVKGPEGLRKLARRARHHFCEEQEISTEYYETLYFQSLLLIFFPPLKVY